MNTQWNTHQDPRATAAACAQHISALLEQALSGQEQATLAVSGGSTPKLLFESLVSSHFRWQRIHVFFVDERAVPPNDPESNYRLANENLIIPARIPPAQVHRIRAEIKPETGAQQYVEDIRNFFGLEEGEQPHFDVLQLGLGPDAHTASLFPGETAIEDREHIAGALYVQKLSKWRITLLPGALLAAKNTVFLVAGADKAPAVGNVFHQEFDPKHYPAQLISRQGRRVTWFLDQAAAAELRSAH
ncbi:MAG TPA: 6-phosphogluconolactonase [Bryobacteraceae bacterium]|nr:6-phosphogluconolactonase [Bryobacteraceae bacterium]